MIFPSFPDTSLDVSNHAFLPPTLSPQCSRWAPLFFLASGCQCIVIHLAVRSVGPVGDFLRCSSYLNLYTPQSLTFIYPEKSKHPKRKGLPSKTSFLKGYRFFRGVTPHGSVDKTTKSLSRDKDDFRGTKYPVPFSGEPCVKLWCPG